MLIAPSWGGMLNGLLTLRGAWDRVREDPVLKFMVVAITAYGMATFEGPMLSLKNVNAIAHYTDWIVAHVHVGGLGWNGFIIFGMFYYLIPKMWNTQLHSIKLANFHFWIGTLGIIFYALPMYWAGFAQSLMWKEFTAEGMLKYPNFLETVNQIKHMYLLRAIGGAMYLVGVFVMVYNLVATAKQGSFVKNEEVEAAVEDENHTTEHKGEHWHRWIERHPVQMLVFSLVVVAIGGLIEIIPTYLVKSNIPTIASVKPYTPLELEGRDIYIREGCNTCHSQMVRPFRSETQRYGEYSKAGEFVYDHPFLWGSKRTGPDLHRVGGKYGDLWHFNHMLSPEITSTGSIMPAYPHLLEKEIDYTSLPSKISAMRTLGVPYAEGYEQVAIDSAKAQATAIVKNLDTESSGKVKANANKEIIAMIAYLQRLGKDIKLAPKTEE